MEMDEGDRLEKFGITYFVMDGGYYVRGEDAADRLSEQQQVIDELASALELMLDSTADIRGIDVEFYCPIAFKASRNALSRAKEAGK